MYTIFRDYNPFTDMTACHGVRKLLSPQVHRKGVYSLSQVGTLPFHCPSAWHVLSAGPFSVYPMSHEYLATSPKEVPALVFT